MPEMFEEFKGKKVKVPYRDGDQMKIAKGELVSVDENFIKVSGRLGTIIINKENVQKMGLLKEVN